MTVENPSTAGAVAPAVTPPSAPATPAAVTPPAPSAPNVGEPDWLNGRLAQAKQSAAAEVLKSLGVDNLEDAKVAIATAKAKSEADKTAEMRAAELKAKLDGVESKSTEQGKIISEIAARQLIGLTAEQKAAVVAVAGDDAGKQLSAIAALQPTWAKPPAVGAPVAAAVTPAPDTAPGHTAPAANASSSPPDHRATYDATQKTNPFAAAQYGLSHPDEVYKRSGT